MAKIARRKKARTRSANGANTSAAAAKPKVAVTSPETGKTNYYNFDEFIRYASLSKIPMRNLASTSTSAATYSKYTKSEIVNYLSNPETNEKALRDMSIYLYNISNYYRRLVQYFANMPTFAWTLSPWKLDLSKEINAEQLRKHYQNAVNNISIMNIPHEFRKILSVAFREDIFYGFLYETKDSFSIQKLDADYCKISSIEDGVYNFAFDFSYFDSKSEELPNYDSSFETMYNTYKSQGQSFRWQELDSKKTICIKINEDSITPIPPFVSLFSALADIEDYRAIAMNASETSNYKMVSLLIPTNSNGDFLLDYDLAKDFYRQLCSVLPENIGAVLTPMKMDSIDFERSGAISDTDIVMNAESNFWSEAGVNKLLFGGGDNPSSSTLSLSTINDQAIVFGVLRQLERWVNRRLKQLSGTNKFKLTFLDVTRYNQKEVHDQLLKDGQYGLPVRNAIMATSGMDQASVMSMAYLENNLLDMKQYEQPLISSNTQSAAQGDPGRPPAEDSGTQLGDAGEKSREQN